MEANTGLSIRRQTAKGSAASQRLPENLSSIAASFSSFAVEGKEVCFLIIPKKVTFTK
jgi:hypothetical protein